MFVVCPGFCPSTSKDELGFFMSSLGTVKESLSFQNLVSFYLSLYSFQICLISISISTVYLSVCLSIYLSIYLSIHHLSIYLLIYFDFCLKKSFCRHYPVVLNLPTSFSFFSMHTMFFCPGSHCQHRERNF